MKLQLMSLILTLVCFQVPAVEIPYNHNDTSATTAKHFRFDFYNYQYPCSDKDRSVVACPFAPSEGAIYNQEEPSDPVQINKDTEKKQNGASPDKAKSMRKYAAIVALLVLLGYAFHILHNNYSIKLVRKQSGHSPKVPAVSTDTRGAQDHSYIQRQDSGTDSPSHTKKQDDSDRSAYSLSSDDNGWSIIGASVIGNGHIASGLPCQDCCTYENLGDGWGIAITSDGAGSAERSDLGSRLVTSRGLEHFKNLILQKKWKETGVIPTDADWLSCSYDVIKSVRNDIIAFATAKNIEYHSLNATMIVVIHTPFGLLSTHVGDGRCGYRSSTGEWLPLMTPHKGEEANQTIFVLSEFWNLHNFVMSGVLVPESRVLREKVTAFVLMSDGCESTSWLCNQYDESTGRYYDPNLPYPKFFNSVYNTLQKMHSSAVQLHERKRSWSQFLTSNGKFAKEQDDKTMLMGVLNSQTT